MTKPITEQTVIARVQEMTRQALEREATKLFALAVVKDKISAAAKEGFTRLAIGPDKGIDLKNTDVAKATDAALRAEGFSIDWEVRQHPDGCTSQTLIIRW